MRLGQRFDDPLERLAQIMFDRIGFVEPIDRVEVAAVGFQAAKPVVLRGSFRVFRSIPLMARGLKAMLKARRTQKLSGGRLLQACPP